VPPPSLRYGAARRKPGLRDEIPLGWPRRTNVSSSAPSIPLKTAKNLTETRARSESGAGPGIVAKFEEFCLTPPITRRISFFGKDPMVFPAGLQGRPNLAQGNVLGTTSPSGQALQGRTKSACPRRRSQTRFALGCLRPPRWGCQKVGCAPDYPPPKPPLDKIFLGVTFDAAVDRASRLA
jgi:hypothetical protein